MSDNSQTVVDVEVSEEEAAALADIVRAWLVTEGIIEPEPSDSVLGGTEGHRPGPNYRLAVETIDDGFLDLGSNGVEIEIGRSVFDSGGNGIELRCDACGNAFEPDDAWSDVVGVWFDGDDQADFPCPQCGHRTLLTEWRGPWPWGFGNLGFQFWNWPPLSEKFIHALGQKLGHRVVVVRQHI